MYAHVARVCNMLMIMGVEPSNETKRKWFSKVAWPVWQSESKEVQQAFLDKARAEHVAPAACLDDLPAAELVPPEAPCPCCTPKKPRMTLKAKAEAFDRMTASTEKLLQTGTPAVRRAAKDIADVAAAGLADKSGKTPGRWKKLLFPTARLKKMKTTT